MSIFLLTNWRQRNLLNFWTLYPLGFTWCSALSLTHQKADSLEPHQEKARILNHWKSSLHCKREQSNGLCDMADLESIAHQGRKECRNCKGIWLLFLELTEYHATVMCVGRASEIVLEMVIVWCNSSVMTIPWLLVVFYPCHAMFYTSAFFCFPWLISLCFPHHTTVSKWKGSFYETMNAFCIFTYSTLDIGEMHCMVGPVIDEMGTHK